MFEYVNWELCWSIAWGIVIGRGIVGVLKIMFALPLKIIKELLKDDDGKN